MVIESDLIRRYTGAFSSDDCKRLIEYIDTFHVNNLLAYDQEKLHEVDHETINITHSYDFPAYSFISREIISKFKPCIDEYLKTFSILNSYKFLLNQIQLSSDDLSFAVFQK